MKKDRIGLFLCLFIIYFQIKTQNVFIPKTESNFSYVPPFTSNLLKEERVREEQEENKNIKEIVTKIVKSSDEQLEKQAEEFIKDQKIFVHFTK